MSKFSRRNVTIVVIVALPIVLVVAYILLYGQVGTGHGLGGGALHG